MDNKKILVEFSHSVDLDNVQFESHGYVAHHAQLTDCRVGDYSSIGRFTKVRCADIGRYCSISWDCTIGAVAHPLTKISTSAIYYRAEYGLIDEDILFPQKRTVLGNDVWIGCNVVISNCRLFGIYPFLQQIVMILSTLIQRDSLSIANRAG